MSTTGDLPGLPDSDVGGDDAAFDELARRAGEALRRPAPEDGVQAIAARRRRQQVLKQGVVGGIAVALIGTLVIVANRDDDTRSVPPATSPTSPPATTLPSPATNPVETSLATTTPSPSTNVVDGGGSARTPVPPTTTAMPAIEPAPFTTPELFTELAPDSMVDLPEPPIIGRIWGGVVWTGTEMIVWGGNAYDPGTGTWSDLSDGAAFNLATGTWRVIASAPISGREQFPAVWTGTEMIVWGGFVGENQQPVYDGAAYNPTTDIWRMLPPISYSTGSEGLLVSMVWTGTEAVLSGGALTIAYDPVADSWRQLADRRVGGAPFWTGDSIIWSDRDTLTRYDVAADAWAAVANPYADIVGVPAADGTTSTFVALPKETGAPTQVLDHDLEPIGELPAFPGDPSAFGDAVGASAKWVGEEAIFTIWAGKFPYEPEERWALNSVTQTWRQLDPAVPEPAVVVGDVMLAWGERDGPAVETIAVAYRSGTTPAD